MKQGKVDQKSGKRSKREMMLNLWGLVLGGTVLGLSQQIILTVWRSNVQHSLLGKVRTGARMYADKKENERSSSTTLN